MGFFMLCKRFLIRCLQSDPENAPCRALFKKIKALKKLYTKIDSSYNKPDYATAAKFAHELHESGDTPHYKFLADVYLCQIYHKLKEFNKALGYCSSALGFDPGHIDALLVRADIYVLREQYDDAKTDYNEILSINSNHQEAKEGLSRIENIQRNLNRPDYYKILNVTKSATTQEIEKSYRRLVKKYHPDRLQNKEDIKAANKKLEQFNSARQVLTDPEMRKRFDDGFDPLDPQDQQRGGGGHHYEDGGGSFFRFFQGGGNPFEGHGGQHFRFTFG
ncbi:DnaJ subfamily C member 3 [Thelohanellus kitauei]|uniref:DnaJ subfamily C member 3 n=1 Tax=Thelohanellus kitauei TaxID=669202 RepID=A0A0C2N5H3_THEKT|nr:DnaJ subfamily C member 3 [Thelohanellus kitauei]